MTLEWCCQLQVNMIFDSISGLSPVTGRAAGDRPSAFAGSRVDARTGSADRDRFVTSSSDAWTCMGLTGGGSVLFCSRGGAARAGGAVRGSLVYRCPPLMAFLV